MKTYEQLMTHYWGVIFPMAEAAGIDPWMCVKYEGRIHDLGHPTFLGLPEHYTFALTVLEGKPVFPGMTIYVKATGDEYIADENKRAWHLYTLTPPTKKLTFIVELDDDDINGLITMINYFNGCTGGELVKKLTTSLNKE